MAENKTKATTASVGAFIKKIADEDRRRDCQTLLRMMKQASRTRPRMWGAGMVGFGEYHYKYASGHEGDCFLIGFAPRKQDLTLYIMPGIKTYAGLLRKLGKHRTGGACLYIKRLADVDLGVLEKIVTSAAKEMKRKHG